MLGFMNRRNGYGNIYTPHAGSMIIRFSERPGLANRTIVLSQRQVALLRIIGSRVGLAVVAVFIATWLLLRLKAYEFRCCPFVLRSWSETIAASIRCK
jgi:hypothetical protein